jgi:septum site-determining protein MinC
MTAVLTQPRPIRLKGRSYLALTLTPELPLEDWLVRLDELAALSAGFFLRRPVVLDIEGLEIDRSQLRDLVARLSERNVRIMGIEGARPSMLGSDLPPAMSGGRSTSDVEAPVAEPAKVASVPEAPDTVEDPEVIVHSDPNPTKPMASVIVTQPVRSGQSLFFPESDVTVIGSVASGAEIVAGGSIHVYGTLRGRAIAGTMGNASARIFCSKLEAELLAIDGFYKTAEDMEPGLRGRGVQIWLEDETLKAGPLA